MKHLIKLTLSTFMTIAAAIPFSVSHASEGFYFGVNVGQSNYDIELNELVDSLSSISGFSVISADMDDSGTSLSFTLGYQVNPNLSFEGGYINLGEVSVDVVGYISPYVVDVNTVIKTDGLFFDIKGQVPINETFSIYGKFGLLKWDSDVTASVSEPTLGSYDASESVDDNDTFFGIGASFNMTSSMALNVDYTFYKLDDLDVDVLSLGIQVGF